MFKKFLFCIGAITALFHSYTIAQSSIFQTDSFRMPHCSIDTAYLHAMLVTVPPSGPSSELAEPSMYPLAAQEVCGHFTIFYEDVLTSSGIGYDDPSPATAPFANLGEMRRDNLCQVINYIESVFDFNHLSTGAIRILVTRSNVTSGGLPFYTLGGLHATIEGFIERYVKTGISPAAVGGYHGKISMQFNWMPVGYPKLSAHTVNSDYRITSGECSFDLAYMELHNLAHAMGFFSFVELSGTSSFISPLTGSPFTTLDRSLHTCPDPETTTNPMASGNLVPFIDPSTFTFTPASVPTTRLFWANGNQAPSNDGIVFFDDIGDDNQIHMHDYRAYRHQNRISPGDFQEYVMGPSFGWGGVYRREFAKGEIETFVNILGYPINPSYASSHPWTNKKPYSSKMNSDLYNSLYFKNGMAEIIPADYTMTNDIGSSITINLASDATLVDLDMDAITIFDGSLFNIRGCGDGTNNHNLLTINSAKNEITYTPRDDFYGRAQFGFNLFDGKEKGGFVVYTINVLKGTRVSVPPGDNIVLNGSFEEGTEVKVLGTTLSESVNNSLTSSGNLYDARFGDKHFADSHPYNSMKYPFGDGQVMINNSCGELSCTYAADETFGDYSSAFPFPWLAPTYTLPSPPIVTDARYQSTSKDGMMFYLGEEMQHCKRYELSFDARRIINVSAAYTGPETIHFGFTDDAHITSTDWATWAGSINAVGLVYSPTSSTLATKTFSSTTWEKAKIGFTYCETDPTNILFLKIQSSYPSRPGSLVLDNVSIKEVPFTITASVEQVGSCLRKLIANEDEIASYGCSPTLYTWSVGGVVIGTGKEITVEPLIPTSYTLVADDGCGHTATTEIIVEPCRCSPYVVFGTSSFGVITSTTTIPSPLPPGIYLIAENITIPSTNTFANSNILINPNVTINVNNNAQLTIDNSHLFVCPDTNKLWEGIVLQSDPATHTSASIEVKNNSLIEDAVVAIKVISPLPVTSTPSNDFIKTNSSVFNRNRIGIMVQDYLATLTTVYPFSYTNTVFTSRNLSSFSGYPFVWPSASSLGAAYDCAAAVPPTCSDARPPFAIDRDYAPIHLKDDEQAIAGIELDKVGKLIGSTYHEMQIGEGSTKSDRNLFDNLVLGISAANSNLTIYNNAFINIHKLNTASTYYGLAGFNGIGLYGNATDKLQHRLRAIGVPSAGNNVLHNLFYNCTIGIFAQDIWNFTSDYNLFQTSNTNPSLGIYAPRGDYQIGIMSSSYQYELNLVQNNLMYNVPIGVYINNANGFGFKYGQNNILSNKFYRQAPSPFTFNPSYYVYQGISLSSNGYWLGTTGTTTGSNIINNNYLKDVHNGIAVNGQNKTNTDATGNHIDLLNNGKAQYAINYANSYKGRISGNDIYGFSGTATSDKARGIYASMTQDLKICDNYVQDIGRGFEFANTRAQTGTKWTNNTMTNNLRGFVLGSDIGDQSIVTSWTPFPTSMLYASNNIWTGGSAAWAGKSQTFVEYNTSAGAPDVLNSQLFVRNLSTEYPIYNFSSPSTHQYQITGSSISIHSSFATIATCYDYSLPPMSLSLLSHWLIADTLAYGTGYHPAQWMGQLAQYQAGLVDTSLSDSSASFARFMSAASASRFAWLSAIEDALANADTAAAQSLLASPVTAMGRVAIDSEVVICDYAAATYVVSNYLDFYSLYLNYLKGNFTSNDTNTLNALTLMCPAKDGAVVHQARAFYDYLLQTHTVYDDDSCIVNGQSTYRLVPNTTEQKMASQHYSLFPNPNEGNFELQQLVAKNQTLSLKVYDALGRVVYDANAHFANGKTKIQLNNVTPGLYLVCIGDDLALNQCIKFTVK